MSGKPTITIKRHALDGDTHVELTITCNQVLRSPKRSAAIGQGDILSELRLIPGLAHTEVDGNTLEVTCKPVDRERIEKQLIELLTRRMGPLEIRRNMLS
ncbi:hypothetical protein CR983_02100 [Candidatus Saccharibacteria bacterium]|nr:MAG: hypothetical protein CR983_02100 [Candidatus Saccharibacteria bacterium]